MNVISQNAAAIQPSRPVHTQSRAGWKYALMVLLVAAFWADAYGQTNSWTAGNGDWENGADWSSGGPPFNGESVYITNSTSKTVTIDTNTTSDSAFSLTIGDLTLSAPGGSTNALKVINADSFPFQMNTLFVGAGGSMLVSNTTLSIAVSNTISNGRLVVLNTTAIPSSLGATNFAWVVTGSSATFSNAGPAAFENVANNSVLVTNGGRMDLDDLYVGFKLSNVLLRANANVFTVTGTNSQLNSGILGIGEVGSSNQFTVGNGAAMHIRGALRLSSTTNTLGNLLQVLPGGALTVGGNVFVGNTNGAGAALKITGGLSTLASNLITASFANSTTAVSVIGGQLVATNASFSVISVGNDGTATNGFGVGTMTVSNATVLGRSILLGSSLGGKGDLSVLSNAVVNLLGSNAVLLANDVTIVGGDVEILNGQIYCGKLHPGAMTMSNGTANSQITYIGYDSQGTLTMVAGQMTISSLLQVGFAAGSTGAVWMSGGQLTATALATTIGNQGVGQMSISNGIVTTSDMFIGNSSNPGTLTLAGGTLTVDSLVLPNSSSRFNFSGGRLNALGITNSNGQLLTLGNGIAPITLDLLGGISSLVKGLRITTNATLSGCGTINGNVTIDSGATVLINCGTLTFNGSVTNNGTVRANGGAFEAYGAVVNNGTIDAINGGTNFHGTFVNNGTVLTASSVKISQVSRSGQNIVIQIPSVLGHTYQLQFTPSLTPTNWMITGSSQSGSGGVLTFTDIGGATNSPGRFYQIDCSAP